MSEEIDLNLVLGRVNAIDSDVREIRSEMQATVSSVNSLRGAVDGMTSKLETLISATGSIQGQRGMVPVSSIHWALGAVGTAIGLMLTVASIIAAMIMFHVNIGDDMVRKDLELLESRMNEAAAVRDSEKLRFRMSSHRGASDYESFE
jgi:hypothetical protein